MLDRLGRRRSWKTFLFNDLRGVSTVLLGTTVYLLLFSAFGGLRRPSKALSKDNIFPRKIWQSWKVDPLSFEDRDAIRARSWLVKNPTFRYEVLTDTSGMAYVEQVFGESGYNRPDIVQTYKSLTAKIIQADLLRYIIMYAEGGIYADIDVEALQPFDNFIPTRFNEKDIDMIIGVETDMPAFKDHPVLGMKAQSLCQWIFVCKPEQPVMLRIIDNILAWLAALAKKEGKSISDLEIDFDEVLTGTGPSAFTAAVLSELSASTKTSVTWDDVHKLKESKVVGRILFLPPEAFAAGTGHSHSGNHNSDGALIKHHFHASSWTKTHPRYKHPVYGEVEKCNWDPECVKLWDANTAYYDTLSEQEQLQMISMKTAQDNKDSAKALKAGPAPGLMMPPDGAHQQPEAPLIMDSAPDIPPQQPDAPPLMAAQPELRKVDSPQDAPLDEPQGILEGMQEISWPMLTELDSEDDVIAQP